MEPNRADDSTPSERADPSTSSRRSVLASVGGLLAAGAGCVTSGDDEDPPATDQDTATPTATPIDPPTSDVTVTDVGVRKAVTYESTMGSGGVLTSADEQYVVASVTAERSFEASQFAFAAGGDTWAPGLPDTAGGVNQSVAGREGRPLDYGTYEPGTEAFLAFAVPSPLSASDPEIRFEGGDQGPWPLDDADRETLAAPEPRFELDAFDAPDEVEQGSTLEVSLTARNVSETDGRFLAALYWPTDLVADDDESHLVEREVAAGETVSVSRSIDTRYTAREDGPVSLRLRGHVRDEREVHVSGTDTWS